ncbi:hypothetical protein, partial [Thermophilibacter sp.]|uniref:hypothetical protein n=1 Tax=Thermophilibacter sp. TaxID=2847309 RepID=UPI003A944BC4
MGMSNNGWVRRRTALLLSATLAVSPVLAVPAFATQDGDAPSPIEQNDDQTTDQGGEKDPEVEKTPDAETVDPEAEKDPDAEQGTGEKDGAAEKDGVPADTTDQPAADQPAAEPRSGDVAQVEKDGNITSYTSLTKAVEAVNTNGGTLKLLADTSEPITISHKGVIVTAQGVEYKGSLTVTGSDCIVRGMDFVLDPAGSVSNSLVVRGAQNLQVLNNSFTIQAKNANKEVQTNSIWIESGSTGTTISGNTFTIGFVVANNSAVAINIVGGSSAIENTNISDNEMTTKLGNLITTDLDGSNMFFIIANGNASGISGLTVNGNSVSDETGLRGKDSRTWGIGISGVSNATITNNTIDGYVAVCGTGWPGQEPCEKLSVSGNTINSYFGVNMPSSNVTEGELAVSNNTFGTNVSSPVGGAVAVSDGEGTCYSSVNAAIVAGETNVVLERNLTESVTIPEGKDVTLDLAGHTLTNADGEHTVTVTKGGTLTVTDSSADKAGVIDNVSHGKGALVNYGTVTVEGGTLTRSKEASKSPTDNGGNSWYVVDNQGTLTFNGGNVVNEGYFSSLVRNAAGTLTINGGTFKNHFIAVKNEDATLYVKGGTITSDEQSLQNWGKATLSGGTLNGRVAAWDQEDDLHSLTTIEGDVTINGDVQAINYLNAKEGPEVIIKGGTVTGKVQKATHDGSTGTTPAEPTADTSTITVSGGTFKNPIDDALIVPGFGLNKNEDGSYGIHEHKLEAVAAKDPTCTEAGNKAYWRCSVCGDLFLDKEMTQPATLADVTIPATGTAEPEEPSDEKPAEGEKGDGLAQTGDPSAVAPLAAAAAAGAGALLGALR